MKSGKGQCRLKILLLLLAGQPKAGAMCVCVCWRCIYTGVYAPGDAAKKGDGTEGNSVSCPFLFLRRKEKERWPLL